MPGKDYAAYKYVDGRGIFYLFPALCKGCGLCLEKCPVDTIGWTNKPGFLGTLTPAPGFGDPCIACRLCEFVCPDCAIRIDKIAPDKIKTAGQGNGQEGGQPVNQ